MKHLLTTTIAIVAIATSTSFAASGTWNNAGAAPNNWSNTAKWTVTGSEDSNLYPNGTDQIATLNTTSLTITNDISGGLTLGGIETTAFSTISGTEVLNLATSTGIAPAINYTSNMIFHCPLAGNQGFTSTALTNGSLTISSNNATTFSGPVTYNGGGQLILMHQNALGADNSTDIIKLDGWNQMALANGITVVGRTLNLANNLSQLYSPTPGASAASSAEWTGNIITNRTGASNILSTGSTANLNPSIFTLSGQILPNDIYNIQYGSASQGLLITKITGANTYTNATLFAGQGSGVTKFRGALAIGIGSNSPFGTGTVTISTGSYLTAFFANDATTRTIANNFVWQVSGATWSGAEELRKSRVLAFGAMVDGFDPATNLPIVFNVPSDTVGSGNIVLNGKFTFQTDSGNGEAALDFIVGQSVTDFSLTLNGVVERTGGTNAATINKYGGGTLILNNIANTYNGKLAIQLGTILVNGNHAGAVDAIYGTLGGTGSIAGAVNILGGGSLIFGTTISTAITPLTIAGALDLATNWTLSLNPSSSWALDEWVRVVNCSTITGSENTFSLVDNTGLVGVENWNIEARTGTAAEQGLWVQAASIPEPTTWALLGASLLVVTLFRRKKIS